MLTDFGSRRPAPWQIAHTRPRHGTTRNFDNGTGFLSAEARTNLPRPMRLEQRSARTVEMDAIILSLLLMLLTWWTVFRVARWLGGWDDRGE